MQPAADSTIRVPARKAQADGRLDQLDGLRTVAVLVVVGFHLGIPRMASGYLGVDLFFVLSGYLITGGLLNEVDRSGTPDLLRFMSRRLRRLMPAAVVVLLVVAAWAAWSAPRFRRAGLGADLWWTTLYSANWHFIRTASYFASDGVESPLLHMWSLAVEEQFYVAWPLCVWLVARTIRSAPGRFRSRRLAIVVAALGLVIAGLSFAMFVQRSGTSIDRAYMGTDTKVFEPLLGALAAVALSRESVRHWVLSVADKMLWLGLISMSYWFVSLGGTAGPSPSYFTFGALGFTSSSVLVVVGLAFGTRANPMVTLLSLAPVAYLGRISYGIYLWHWPLTLWLTDRDHFSVRDASVTLVATIAAASLSYHLIESPLRTLPLRTRRRHAGVLGSAAAVVAASLIAIAALGGTPMSPTVRQLAGLTQPSESTVPGVVLMVGDSVPQRLMPALSTAGTVRGLTVTAATAGGCSVIGVHTKIADDDAEGRKCSALVDSRQAKNLLDHRPSIVVWWSRYELADRFVGNALLTAGTPEFWSAQLADFDRTVERLTALGATVVLVETDRTGRGIYSRCSPAKCHPFLRRLADHDELRVTWNRLMAERVQQDSRLRIVKVDDLYCRDEAAPCDDSLDGSGALARPDGSHFSEQAAPSVAAGLLDRVLQAVG